MEKLKWTIGIINLNSLEFIEHQLKYFHEFCSDFEFIIYDNDSVKKNTFLDDISKKYKNIRVIQTPNVSHGLHSHGLGLNACVQMAQGKYILLMDPDFFWIKKNILSLFEHYFDQGCHAIGTEDWNHSFPMPWGAAYITDEIRDLDLRSKCHPCDKCHAWVSDLDHGTGFQLRIRLKNKPHHAFKKVLNQIPDLGKLNNTGYSQTYAYDTKAIAHHLKGGSQIEETYTKEQVEEIRSKYTEWMWSQLYD
jgi:hypothetical protein